MHPHLLLVLAFAAVAFAARPSLAQIAATAPSHASGGDTSTVTRELRSMVATLTAAAQSQPFDFAAYRTMSRSYRERLAAMIAADELRTADDFLLASSLAADPTGFYENRRVEHELALAALVLGHPEAMTRVARSWDSLNWSVGRGQRLGSFTRDGAAVNVDPVPAPAAVQRVFADLETARARAQGATPSAELQRLRDEDQADRAPPATQAKFESMRVNDPIRRARVLALVAEGSVATGRDFHNAALVMQHGDAVDDYRLAHELAIAAVALGDSSAVWLVSRSYDRLLLKMGHRQRFDTQFANDEAMPSDGTAINDRIRAVLGGRTSQGRR